MKQESAVQILILAKSRFASIESAQEWATARGFNVSTPEDREDCFKFLQRPSEEFDGLRQIHLEEGVSTISGVYKNVNKRLLNCKVKAVSVDKIDAEKGTVESYVSTFEWDRTGERFNKGAWMLENFKKNPVVLWSHSHSMPPIGKSVSMEEDEKGLKAVTQFDLSDPFAAKVFRLFKEGFMSSFSVGFRPLAIRAEEMHDEAGNKRQGLIFDKAELVEYSAVPVPANPGATLSREDAEVLAKDGLPGLWIAGDGNGFKVVPIGDVIEKELSKPDINDMEQYEATMKYILDLCKMHKGGRTLGEDKLALAKNAATALTELISSYQGEPNKEQIAEVMRSVQQLAKTVEQIYGDPRGTARKLVQAFNRSF